MNRILVIVLLSFLSLSLVAQREYMISMDSSRISIKGTSTFHDWEAYTQKISGSVYALIEDNRIKELSVVDVSVEVKSLISETKGLAKRLRKELGYQKFPEIVFKMKQVITLEENKLVIEGELTIKGVSKNIVVGGDIQFNGQNNEMLLVLGTKKIKMMDFNIKAPKFLFGMFKTGEEVDVEFEISLIN
jgi:polyisoprenoid-binding protein YceI